MEKFWGHGRIAPVYPPVTPTVLKFYAYE